MNNYLKHYGVLGMKWGIRRYQPYPSDKGPNGKFVGANKSIKQQNKTSKRRNTVAGFSDMSPDMQALMVQAIASTAIIGLSVIGAEWSYKKQVKTALNSVEKSNIKNFNDIKRIKPPEEMTKSYKSTNPNFTKGTEYQMNCANSTMAYELRRRGYSVEALPRPVATQNSFIAKMYNTKFKEVKNPKGVSKFEVMDNIAKKWGDGGRGSVTVASGFGIGHVFSVEVKGGKVIYVDPQTGYEIKNGIVKYYDSAMNSVKEVDMAKNITNMTYIRTDDKRLNPDILTMVKKAG